MQIQQELTDKLGIVVDLNTENTIKHPMFKEYIYRDIITIFDGEKRLALS